MISPLLILLFQPKKLNTISQHSLRFSPKDPHILRQVSQLILQQVQIAFPMQVRACLPAIQDLSTHSKNFLAAGKIHLINIKSNIKRGKKTIRINIFKILIHFSYYGS
jgi:hypothetical protein